MHSRREYEVTKIGMAQRGGIDVYMNRSRLGFGSIQPAVSCAHSGLLKSSGTSFVSVNTTLSNCVLGCFVGCTYPANLVSACYVQLRQAAKPQTI
jgi:hypothetical protein